MFFVCIFVIGFFVGQEFQDLLWSKKYTKDPYCIENTVKLDSKKITSIKCYKVTSTEEITSN